jgi:hypothetical protein
MSEAAAGGSAPGPGGASGSAPASTPGDRTETVSLTLRRSAAAQSGLELGEGEVERGVPVVRGRLGPDRWTTGPDGQLDPLTAVRLPRVAFFGDLHVDPHRLLVKLLELG